MRKPSRFNWLLLLLASWGIPVFVPHSYLFSLVFWVLPVAVVLFDVLAVTDTPTHRRRRALVYATAWIVLLGIVLDFGLGRYVLTFTADWYWFRIFGIPVEELLFYVFAPMAILLVYAWCDEHWLSAYNRSAERDRLLAEGRPLLILAPWMVGAAAVLLALAAVAARQSHGRWLLPLYPLFITLAAVLPAMVTYRAIEPFVNWHAFGATTLWVIGTSLAHEVTLAIPLGWWGYQDEATMGIVIAAWSTAEHHFPLEAAVVWVSAPFSCILTYEFAKAYLHHPVDDRRTRLLGSTSAARPR